MSRNDASCRMGNHISNILEECSAASTGFIPDLISARASNWCARVCFYVGFCHVEIVWGLLVSQPCFQQIFILASVILVYVRQLEMICHHKKVCNSIGHIDIYFYASFLTDYFSCRKLVELFVELDYVRPEHDKSLLPPLCLDLSHLNSRSMSSMINFSRAGGSSLWRRGAI